MQSFFFYAISPYVKIGRITVKNDETFGYSSIMESGYLFLDGLRNIADRLARIIMSVHFLYELCDFTSGNAFAVHENNHLLQSIVRTSASVVSALNTLEKKFGKLFPKIFKTITVDNGVEFSDCVGLETSIYGGQRTKVYYCHPYSSYERGTNERLNREIRRKIPKGSDLTKYSEKEIQAIEDWMNDYPRQVLGFATPNELFNACLLSI